MSQDRYQLDRARHGGTHVDRYTRYAKNVGRYGLDKTPIKHKGKLPPPVPKSDYVNLKRPWRRSSSLERATRVLPLNWRCYN
ncbi:MAG TPA: hypothetical protein VGR35_03695 [Tepidisphaeraceae bacterium]|nr:hypothetical protein [Tepidisphaeraceae bacterium]